MASGNSSNGTSFYDFINGNSGAAQDEKGITTKAFALNLATGLALFSLEVVGFFSLKSSDIGRRIYQPKNYLVPELLRVEEVPRNPLRWIYRIFTITSAELKAKCGLDGYFYIRLIRAVLIIFLPLMAIIVTVLLPVNYNGGKNSRVFVVAGQHEFYNVTGLDTLSWQNVAPTETNRYWAHLVCALLAISWALYRIYREKLHFITVRQQYLLSPEHRLKASARTVLVTNIPSEFQSKEALKALYDVFVDNDDRSKLHVWMNRDFGPLKALVLRRRKLRHALEKEELRILRLVNKQRHGNPDIEVAVGKKSPQSSSVPAATEESPRAEANDTYRNIMAYFEEDCRETEASWQRFLKRSKESQLTIAEYGAGNWKIVSPLKLWYRGPQRSVPKTAWLRAEIARLTVQIDEMLLSLDAEGPDGGHDGQFKQQNSAFIQFDRQMVANMACSLVAHHLPGRMAPRYLDVAPHEILWPNMGITSLGRFVRTCIALVLFVGMLILWGIPATILGFLSQLDSLRGQYAWLSWLKPWPSYLISLIAGPVTAILLALLVQLVVPALCRKLAVLVGTPTRSTREVVTQGFYFTFLFVELVLVTSISSGVIATVPKIIDNPASIANTLATNLPKAANYFFNYIIIQSLAFSASVLFQYLRVLYITLIWPWFTQTPREEAWLQTTIPHQMWGNVYPLVTNLAVIGMIYSVIAPLMLIFTSATFMLFWVAYRHNYYYVQRVKVDTHGMLFENALSQLFAGIYVLEIALIGLFFLVRNSNDNVACTPQAIIMIVALALTASFHYILEQKLRPLYELLPVTLEDSAAEAEQKLHPLTSKENPGADRDTGYHESGSSEESNPQLSTDQQRGDSDEISSDAKNQTEGRSSGVQKERNPETAANARMTQSRLKQRIAAKLAIDERRTTSRSKNISRRREVADQLGAAIAEYPDELADLSIQERDAELQVAYQDPLIREPAPVIWIPQDSTGISEDMIKQASKYGKYLQYSNAGAYLTKGNKCEITQPAPDVRADWLLEWAL